MIDPLLLIDLPSLSVTAILPIERSVMATGLAPTATQRSGGKVVTACGSQLVLKLRFSLRAKKECCGIEVTDLRPCSEGVNMFQFIHSRHTCSYFYILGVSSIRLVWVVQ